MTQSNEQITALLQSWQNGNTAARDDLFQIVYGQLRRIAQHRISGEGRRHSLQATELVHEIYPQLARQNATWQNRSQFFAIASECMRRFLVDYARSRTRQKRGGNNYQISFSDLKPTEICRIENNDEILAVDRALAKLSDSDEKAAIIIKHRYFGGLSREEIAEILNVSPATIDRTYRFAKAWLRRELAFEFSPYLLKASQIRRPQLFPENFSFDSKNIFAKYLRASFSEDLIIKIDNLRTDATISSGLMPEIIKILNKQLLNLQMFSPALVKMLSPETKIADNGHQSLNVADQIRFNRRLLEAAFSDEIEKILA